MSGSSDKKGRLPEERYLVMFCRGYVVRHVDFFSIWAAHDTVKGTAAKIHRVFEELQLSLTSKLLRLRERVFGFRRATFRHHPD